MLAEMDAESIQEERELVPLGDIRQKGCKWLRKAFQKSSIKRVPREAEFRKLVKSIDKEHRFCAWVKFNQFGLWSVFCWMLEGPVVWEYPVILVAILYLRFWYGRCYSRGMDPRTGYSHINSTLLLHVPCLTYFLLFVFDSGKSNPVNEHNTCEMIARKLRLQDATGLYFATKSSVSAVIRNHQCRAQVKNTWANQGCLVEIYWWSLSNLMCFFKCVQCS